MSFSRFGIAVAGWVLAGAVAAQPIAPREYTQGTVRYMTGGIGSDEAQMMRDAAANYPLTLELGAAAGGPRDEYISNAGVRILDSGGSLVLETRTEGPFLLVQLPAGVYAVDVEWNGVHRQKTVEIGARRQHLMLGFPGTVELR